MRCELRVMRLRAPSAIHDTPSAASAIETMARIAASLLESVYQKPVRICLNRLNVDVATMHITCRST